MVVAYFRRGRMWMRLARWCLFIVSGLLVVILPVLHIHAHLTDTSIISRIQVGFLPFDTFGTRDVLERKARLESNATLQHEEEFKQRRARIEGLCSSLYIPGQVEEVYIYKNVSYCSNHKVASTYWLQIFRFLHGDTMKPVQRPSDISKYETHLTQLKKGERRIFYKKKDTEDIMSSYRFMMARDPYQRLWSVYVDKFILFDNWFWSHFGPEIRKTYKNRDVKLQSTNSTTESEKRISKGDRCPQISFEEFLYYIVYVGRHSASNLDDHIRPVHYGCNPCVYKPDFVGKVETLNLEKTPLLVKLGIEDVDEVKSFEDHVRNEIHTLSEFGFKLMSMVRQNCLSKSNMEERLIQGFILNGYLPEGSLELVRHLLPIGERNFEDKLMEIFLQSARSHAEVSAQRKRMRLEAYKAIPYQILRELQEIYKYDFLLFGYDPSPVDIFVNGTDFSFEDSVQKNKLGVQI